MCTQRNFLSLGEIFMEVFLGEKGFYWEKYELQFKEIKPSKYY